MTHLTSSPPTLTRHDFPENFQFGTATSSYQIEGTRFGNCPPSHWDHFAKSGGTANFEDGTTACAHYQNWAEDLNLIQQAGFNAYRFSSSWGRIMPDRNGSISSAGIEFYDRLIDGLLERGIAPHLTLYHWDLPQYLADKGGWENRDTALYFADYARIIAQKFSDRLRSIATINEPWCVSWLSYFLGHHAPGKCDISAAARAMHHVMLAHGLGMTAMRAVLPHEQDCQLGIVLNMEKAEPISPREEDVFAAQIYDGIYNRWFADAIFNGTYPSDILEYLSVHLPENWEGDMKVISQPIDWLGLNYYTRSKIQDDQSPNFPFGGPVQPEFNPSDTTRSSMNWEIYPEGMSFFLRRIQQLYAPNIPLIISENGMALFDQIDQDWVDDPTRIRFFESHLQEVLKLRAEGIPVDGYFAWSLLDNFEWAFGYDQRFGIIHVDFETQKRTPKASWHWWKSLLAKA